MSAGVDGRQLGHDLAVEAVGTLLRSKGRDGVEFGERTALAALGFSSVDLVELLLILEDLADAEVDPDSGDGLETVGDLGRLRAYE